MDIDHGTYPYVTSSNTVGLSSAIGAGVPALVRKAKIVGIAKAYLTRVGSGPFPTELLGESFAMGEKIRQLGAEFGATTGRPRRTGWLDLVALKYAVDRAGIDEIALMKSDILDGFSEVCFATSYQDPAGHLLKTFPIGPQALAQVKPVYQTHQGWKTSLQDDSVFQKYIEIIETYVGVPVTWVGHGPDRSAVYFRGVRK